MFGRPPFTSISGPPRASPICGSIYIQYAGKNSGEAHDIAAIQRQVHNAPVVDETGQSGRSGIDQWRIRTNGDLLFDRPYLQYRVNAQILADGQFQPGLRLFRETLVLERQLILARREGDDRVVALGIRLRCLQRLRQPFWP